MEHGNNGHKTAVLDTAPKSPANVASAAGRGTLIIIGGHEEKTGDREILHRVAEAAEHKKIAVATLASSVAEETWQDYKRVFRELKVKEVVHLDVPDRGSSFDKAHIDTLDGASLIFFAGGDQLEITTKIGGTELCDKIQDMFRKGVAVAGTSAGASVMSETMLIGTSDDQSNIAYSMAPGLGFLRHIVIDQHFAQRGRIGRLLSAVARNPRMLGIGIDENTAIVVNQEKCDVIGRGSVYVIDGRALTATNLANESEPNSMSIYDVRLHVLNCGDRFDLAARKPLGHIAQTDHEAKKSASR